MPPSQSTPRHEASGETFLQTTTLFVLFLGIAARFVGLAHHFVSSDDLGPLKTILDSSLGGQIDWFAVPKAWTYAPIQFLWTSLLINFDQSYRELLFWGRFPSFFFSAVGLISIFLYKGWFENNQKTGKLLLLTLLACSLESIIQSKQSYNYALGLTAAIWVVIVYLHSLSRCYFSMKQAFVTAVLLGLFCGMYYSVVFFYPAFFLGLWLFHLGQTKQKLRLTFNYFVCGLLVIGFVFPLWHFFVRSDFSRRQDYFWMAGPNLEFLFTPGDHAGVLTYLKEAIVFYSGHFWTVFKMIFQFTLNVHPLWNVFYAVLLVLFFLGLFSFMTSTSRKKRFIAVFMFVLALTWALLISRQILLLAPTRHQIVLIVIMGLSVCEGVLYVVRKAPSVYILPHLLTVVIVLSFLFSYPGFLNKRKDPFNEKQIIQTLQDYRADAVIMYANTMHPMMMKSIRDYYGHYETGYMEWEIIGRHPFKYDRIAWISQMFPLNAETYAQMQHSMNSYLSVRNMFKQRLGQTPKPLITLPYQAYEVIYSDERPSDVTMELNSGTRYTMNHYYLYILQRKGS